MTQSVSEPVIALPQWYARFGKNGVRSGASSESIDSTEVVHLGPLTIYRPERGCEAVTWGNPENPNVALFDGYLFDKGELADALRLDDNASGAALVAAGYERGGAEVIDRLDGCYLAAIWDGAAQKLLVAHDALGRHPVFYAVDSNALWFSSNILALASSGHVSRRPNRLSLALGALLYWPEAGQTFFESISRLRPGHYLEVTSGRAISQRKYWDPLPEDDEPWLPDGQVLEMFEPALVQAVSRCMKLAPQGVMLSGGIDSVTVAAIADEYSRARSSAPLVGVSARTGFELSYEERMQSRVTEALKMPHVVSTTLEWRQGRDDVGLSFDATPELPSPSRIFWVGTYMSFYRRTAAERLRVLLTGAGGDNWLGVSDTRAADLLRHLQLRELTRLVQADTSTGGGSIGSAVRRLVWQSGVCMHLHSLWARLAPEHKAGYHRQKWIERLPAWLCPDRTLRDELIDHLLGRRTPALTNDGTWPRSYYRHGLRSHSNLYMHYENEVAFHIEAACGLRLLSPYHDRRLVSFFNRISPSALVHGNRYKGLLRPVVAKHLPGLGLEDQRKEYSKTAESRLLGQLRRSIADAWPQDDFRTLSSLGVVDPGVTRTENHRYDGKGFVELIRMFTMMSAEKWLRAHAAV